MKALGLILVALLLCGCATVAPNPALVIWNDPDPWLSAWLHAERIDGMAYRAIGTSMEPFIFENDYEVADFGVAWETLKPGMIVTYDPNWADASVPLVSHMLVSRTGDGWIATGINNQHSESGARALMREDYRATVVAVFTPRTKPR